MRMNSRLLTTLLGGVFTLACSSGGGSGNTGGGDTGGMANTGGSGGSGGEPSGGGSNGTGGGGNASGGNATGGNATGGNAMGGNASGGGGSGGGASTVTVTGTVVVVEGDTETPIEGAAVAVYGTSLSTTSDESGDFTLEDVPRGDLFFSASLDGYWGTIDFYSVPGETSGGIQLGLGTEGEIEALGEALDRTIDDADAVIDLAWDGAIGDESATLDVDADDPFTFDEDGLPVAQDGVIADSDGYADQVFTGVDPDDSPVGVTVMGTDGETDCSLDASPGTRFPVVAKSISFVYAVCEPSP